MQKKNTTTPKAIFLLDEIINVRERKNCSLLN